MNAMEINNMDLIKEIYKTIPWGDPGDDLRSYTIEYKIMNIEPLMGGKPYVKVTMSLFGIYKDLLSENESIYIGKVIANIEYINNKIQCYINRYKIAPDFQMLKAYTPFKYLTAPEEPNEDIIMDLVEKADIISREQIIKYIKEEEKNDMEPEKAFTLYLSSVMYKRAPDASGYVLRIFKVEDPAGKFGNEKVYRFEPRFHRNMTVDTTNSGLFRYETTIGFSLSLTDHIPQDVLSFINDHFNIYKNYSIFYSIENTWDLPNSFDLLVTNFNNILNKNQINCNAVMSFKSLFSDCNLKVRNIKLRERLEKYIKEEEKNDMEPETFTLHFNFISYKTYKHFNKLTEYKLHIYKVYDPYHKLGHKIYRLSPKFHKDITKSRRPGSWVNTYKTVLGFSLYEMPKFDTPQDVRDFIDTHDRLADHFSIIYSIEDSWDLPAESFDLTVFRFNNILNMKRIDCQADMAFVSELDDVVLRHKFVRPTWAVSSEIKNNAALKSEVLASEETQLYWKNYAHKLGRYLVPGTFEIKDIKFSGIATIVFWNDNTKTVVKMDKTEKEFDVEKAIMAAYMKKVLETMGGTAKERSLDEVLKKYTAKYEAEKKEAKKKSKKTKKKD